MDYKAMSNMYSVECAACPTPLSMHFHAYHYRTGYELCRKCTKEKEKTRFYYIEIGYHCLEIETAADDLDQRFTAKCLDTGETLKINGWLIDHIERI